jgi:hypothetical protein
MDLASLPCACAPVGVAARGAAKTEANSTTKTVFVFRSLFLLGLPSADFQGAGMIIKIYSFSKTKPKPKPGAVLGGIPFIVA